MTREEFDSLQVGDYIKEICSLEISPYFVVEKKYDDGDIFARNLISPKHSWFRSCYEGCKFYKKADKIEAEAERIHYEKTYLSPKKLINLIKSNMEECNVGKILGPLYESGYKQGVDDVLRMMEENLYLKD